MSDYEGGGDAEGLDEFSDELLESLVQVCAGGVEDDYLVEEAGVGARFAAVDVMLVVRGKWRVMTTTERLPYLDAKIS